MNPTMPGLPTGGDAPDWIAWVIGALIFVITTLSGVIVYLFKLYLTRSRVFDRQLRAREDEHSEERGKWHEEKAAWDAEREAENAGLELNYEKKTKELALEYIRQGTHDREQHIAREEQIRVHNAELQEKIANKSAESSAKMVALLQKLHARVTGRRRGDGGVG